MKINVIGHPNSKKPRIEEDFLGYIHVYVSAPPLDGRANRAIIDALVNFYKVKRSDVFQISGYKSKNKIFEINLSEKSRLSKTFYSVEKQ